jgi:hypothetical protein
MKRTVLVVGAGASAEAGLPIGSALTSRIAKLLDIDWPRHGGGDIEGDALMIRALQSHAEAQHTDFNHLIHCANRVRDGMLQAPSIDSFLDQHKADTNIALCGKLAIVRAILEAEQQSSMYVEFMAPGPEQSFRSPRSRNACLSRLRVPQAKHASSLA